VERAAADAVRRLQWQVRGLAVLCLLMLGLAAATPAPTRIDMVSPDGKSRIIIRAENGIAGVWAMRDGKTAALWSTDFAGTAVAIQGVRGQGTTDAVMSCNTEGGFFKMWDAQTNYTLQGVGKMENGASIIGK
jgi:hypothetical protein